MRIRGERRRQLERRATLLAVAMLLIAQLAFVGLRLHSSEAAAPGALNFNGNGSYVRVTDNASLRISTNLTVEAWIKPTVVTGHRHVVGKNNWELSVEPSGSGFIAKFEILTSGSWKALSSSALSFGQWYHVAGAYDGSNMRLWVNGVRVASRTTSGGITQTSNPLRIASADGTGDFFTGFIDEVRVSNAVRYTSNFVVATSPFTTDANTKGLWHLDEGSGASTADASGNNNTGTFVGSPTWTTDSPFQPPSVTPPVISAVTAANITTSSAIITWTTDKSATSQVKYGTTTTYGSNTTLDPALVTTHSQTVTGLSANTTYNYQVVSTDAIGNTATSGNFVFTTLASNPPAPPVISSMAAANITTSSATVTWLTDVPSDSQVDYGLSTSYGSSSVIDAALVTTHSQNLTGLAPNTTYHFRVKSRGQNGQLATSGDGVFTTGSSSSAATVGQWSSVLNWPIVAVHMGLLPNGDVVMWDAWETSNVSARVWNPTSQTFTAVTNTISAIFCSGHVMIADGRILVIGGFAASGVGIKDTDAFNLASLSWTRMANMNLARWYPSALELSDGRVLAVGGEVSPGVYADIPEIYNPTANTWTPLTNAQLAIGEYPNLFLLPNGKVFMVADGDGQSHTLDTSTQIWATVGNAPVATGSSAMYLPGKIITAGGGTNDADPVTNGTATIDMNQANPAWQQTASMAYPRFMHNLVVLPDGKVLAIGGSTLFSLVSTTGVLAAEMWDPATRTWATMSAMHDLRMYHSTALLLPDGRILVAGGGRVAPANDYLTAEIYSPPYLFKGPRPAIASAPASATYGANINVGTPDAASITSMALVKLGEDTHSLNMDQRYVPLTYTTGANGLNAQIPSNPNLLPPGNYMLFIVNGNGVPSVAAIINIGGMPPSDTVAPAVSLTAPAQGATVSGATVSVTANASDNVGVVSVQFLLDGAALGAPVTAGPYTLTWDSTSASNGSHTLSAQARDAAGNTSTSSVVPITVSNSSGGSTPPVISLVTATNVQTNGATITWATDKPANSQVEYGTSTAYGATTTLDATLTLSHSQTLSGLSTNTMYHYRVRSVDANGNAALSSDFSFTTPGSAPATLVGDTKIEAGQDYNAAGIAESFLYTATASGQVNTLSVYLDATSTATSVVLGLYANTLSDNPGTLLAQATITQPVAGWNSVSIPSASITAGGKYWITILGPLGGGVVRFRDIDSGVKAQISAQWNLSTLPSSWTSGATYFNSPMSAYASFAQTGATATVLANTAPDVGLARGHEGHETPFGEPAYDEDDEQADAGD